MDAQGESPRYSYIISMGAFKLVLLTTPYFFVEEHAILSTLFDEGLELLHMRKPNSEPVYSERLLSLLPERYRKRIITHDHFYLKQEFGLKGIHLNQRNTAAPDNYRGQISCTCRNKEELQQRKKQMDYVFLSLSPDDNQEASSIAPEEELATMGKLIDKKVYAAGGVTIDNLLQLKERGFGGAVLYGEIWNRFNIFSNQDFKDLINHFRKLKKIID